MIRPTQANWDITKYNILKSQRELNDIQEKISTGKEINKPSDNPSEWYNIQKMKEIKNNQISYMNNISFLKTKLDPIEKTLTGVTDVMNQMNELVLGIDGVSTSEEKTIYVNQMISYRDTINSMIAGIEINTNRTKISDTLDIPQGVNIDYINELNNIDFNDTLGTKTSIDNLFNETKNRISNIGIHMKSLDLHFNNYNELNKVIDIGIGSKEDLNLGTAVIELNKRQTILDSILKVTSRTNKTLMDYL